MRTIAVDSGQTGLRLRLRDGETDTVVHGDGFAYSSVNPGVQLADQILKACGQLPIGRNGLVDSIGIGFTGEFTALELAQVAGELRSRLGSCAVRIAHDSVTAHLGALGGRSGVVVAAGTGVVALGLAPDGSAVRVDGWGSVLGDEGGGFALGRDGLRAALRAYDGRGPTTLLQQSAEQKFGELPHLPRVLYGRSDMIAMVADFSRAVVVAAREGDDIAREICLESASSLASTAGTAVNRLLRGGGWSNEEQPTGVPVSFTGGISAVTELILEPCREQLHASHPFVEVVAAKGDPLDGAQLLADQPEDGFPGDLVGWQRLCAHLSQA